MKNLGTSASLEFWSRTIICGTGWYLTYPYEMEKLLFLFFRKPGKSPFKVPFQHPHHRMCWQYNPSYLKRSASLNKNHVSTVVWDISLWCSQLFLIFVMVLQSVANSEHMFTSDKNRRMPYILWTVNKSVNWLFCSQNSVTTGISRHSNWISSWKWDCSKVIAPFLPTFAQAVSDFIWNIIFGGKKK